MNKPVQAQEKSGGLWIMFRTIVNIITTIECFATAPGVVGGVHSTILQMMETRQSTLVIKLKY